MNRREFEKTARLAAQQRQEELEAQTGNPNFQHGYDADCPLCLRGIDHSDQEHEAALVRNRLASQP